jgi:pyranose oxidase
MSNGPDETVKVDALIVGSGPIGATYARKLVEAGKRVLMVDIGPKMSDPPGAHLKNSALYQRNLDLFSSVIRGHLNLVSIPSNNQPVVTLDPAAFQVDMEKYAGFVHNNQNPEQSEHRHLEAAAVTYAVGGMATHWTCASPRHHPTIERSTLLDDAEWDRLYTEAESLLNVTQECFKHSIRHQLVEQMLAEEYTELPDPYAVQPLPLAAHRREDNPRFVHWTGTDTVLGPLATDDHDGRFDLRAEHVCRRLEVDPAGGRILFAEVEDLARTRTLRVEADDYVVAANAVGTPQLLWASGIRPEPLGRYLTEQPVAFCQIVLRHDTVGSLIEDERFAEQVAKNREEHPDDPVPIPREDPEPNAWIPVSEDRPWHCQIHRDAFHYGEVAPNVDSRLIVDLRWFGIVQPRPENRVMFSDRYHDVFDLPQPTFDFTLNEEEREQQHRMMKDMLRAASALGGFLPGSEPQFVKPGLPLHFAGTVRMGDDPATSVCDTDSKVWGFDNLYVGGNGVIPTGQASNPTPTSIAFAVRGSESILGRGGG